MKDLEAKIRYIYFNADGIYYFLSTQGISDHSRRCILRRYFILVDSYFKMIGSLKNDLFRNGIITVGAKQQLEKSIIDIKIEWDYNYEIIRNKYSAHQQNVDDVMSLQWWNEIDYSTITFFYEGMNEIRSLLLNHANVMTVTPTDYEEIDFSGTYLQQKCKHDFFLAHDRLALAKENTVGMIPINDFQRKCMLILSIVDFVFINCSVTMKTERFETNYKKILFDAAWLLICCDTVSLLENLYEDGDYGQSLLSISPTDWKGRAIIQSGNAARDAAFETALKELRNKFAAHIDTEDGFAALCYLFDNFDLAALHAYCFLHAQTFQRACLSDIRTKTFALLDQKLSDNVLGLAYSEHRTIDK